MTKPNNHTLNSVNWWKKRILFELTGATLITLSLFAAEPTLSNDYKLGADAARRALMLLPDVKRDMKQLEKSSIRQLEDKTGLTKPDLIYFSVAFPLVTGKVTTKPFKKLRYKSEHFNIRPELEYDFKNNNFSGMLIFEIPLFK